MITKIVCHGKPVQAIAAKYGWQAGARYTNLRDTRDRELFFLDIDWKNYCFDRHLAAAAVHKPKLTVARDIQDIADLDCILREAESLNRHADKVIVVPKDVRLGECLETHIPAQYRLGYSVPTKYGGTRIPTKYFKRDVHLLGGRPDVQRRLSERMNVASIDCNRFTYDAQFGDYFDGERFVPHPTGGYQVCLESSLHNINMLWANPIRQPSLI